MRQVKTCSSAESEREHGGEGPALTLGRGRLFPAPRVGGSQAGGALLVLGGLDGGHDHLLARRGRVGRVAQVLVLERCRRRDFLNEPSG